MSKIPVVKFNNVEEFCEELTKDRPDHGIVRVIFLLPTE